MFEAWQVGIFVRMTSNVAQGMGSIAGSTGIANARLNEQNKLLAMNAERQRALRAQSIVFAVGALAIGAAMVYGAESAGRLQLAMTTVQAATGATTDQLAKLQAMVVATSNVTAQSADTIAQEMATAAKAGLNSYDRLRILFPQLARFADVQYFAAQASGRSLSVNEAISVGTQFAHLFQAYTPQKMGPMLEDLNKIMLMQPEGIQKLLMQGKYFIPMATTLGISPHESMEILAMMGQTGLLRGRGGTSIENTLLAAINATMLTGHLQTARSKALEELGWMKGGRLTITSPGGHLDWAKMMSTLDAAANRMAPDRYVADLQAALGRIGLQGMAVFTSPAFQKQFTFIESAWKKLPEIQQFFDEIQADFLPTMRRFWTNLQNVFMAVMIPTLPLLTSAFNALGIALANINLFFMAHPQAGLATAITAFTAMIGFAALATANLWRLNSAILSLGASSTVGGAGTEVAEGAAGGSLLSRFGGWLAPIGLALTRFIPVVAIVTGGIAMLILQFKLLQFEWWEMTHGDQLANAVSTWWSRNQYKIGYTIGYGIGWIGQTFVSALQALWSLVVVFLGALVQNTITNPLSVFMPGGLHRLINNAEYQSILEGKRAAHQHGAPTIWQGLGAGAHAGYTINNHHNITVHVHGNTSNATEAKKTAKHVAEVIWSELLEKAQTSAGKTGSLVPVHPYYAVATA